MLLKLRTASAEVHQVLELGLGDWLLFLANDLLQIQDGFGMATKRAARKRNLAVVGVCVRRWWLVQHRA
jgi:hypothetical protein